MSISGSRVAIAISLVLGVCAATSQASTVTVSLVTSPGTVLSAQWAPGSLIEINVQATSDGGAGQGFAGGDFGRVGHSISVDGTCLKIHDITMGAMQVDTESLANGLNGVAGYSKAGDSWAYDKFSDFTLPDTSDPRNVIMTNTSMRIIPSAVTGQLDLGRGAAVNFLHLVLEVQPGFTSGMTSMVTFYGQVGAFNVAQPDVRSNLFGSLGGDTNTGTLTLTQTPEPVSALLMLCGGLGLLSRRGGRRA